LRKVPDDPSGLMRNKFRYQYMQRRQSLRDGNHSNNEAEQRW
jgi:Ca-activated chloride channel family protein